MLPVCRIGDTYSDTDVQAQGSGDVFANGIPAARLGDLTAGHTLPGHTFYPPAPTITGSGSVFVNGLPVVRLGDLHATHCDQPHPSSDCHDAVVTTGSGNVFSG